MLLNCKARILYWCQLETSTCTKENSQSILHVTATSQKTALIVSKSKRASFCTVHEVPKTKPYLGECKVDFTT